MLHGIGLANTRHEKAELLRRAMGSAGGSVYIQDGKVLDVDHMSDDDVLALERETRGQRATPVPPAIAGAMAPKGEYTTWGWSGQPPYMKARTELATPRTHETLNGKVPTIEEARRMIRDIGGTKQRFEPGHPPGGVSTHDRPHINYELPNNGGKATVYVRGG